MAQDCGAAAGHESPNVLAALPCVGGAWTHSVPDAIEAVEGRGLWFAVRLRDVEVWGGRGQAKDKATGAELEAANAKIKALTDENNQLKDELAKLQLKLKQAETEIASLKADLAALKEELKRTKVCCCRCARSVAVGADEAVCVGDRRRMQRCGSSWRPRRSRSAT